MTVTAAGDYTTPIGVPATVVGNYVWTASYSGDSDNLGAVVPSTAREDRRDGDDRQGPTGDHDHGR